MLLCGGRQLLEGAHSGLGAAMTREEAPQIEARGRILGMAAQRGLERAGAVGRATGEVEAGSRVARVVRLEVRLRGLGVLAERLQERACMAGVTARAKIAGGAERGVPRRRSRELLRSLAGERVISAERGEERGSARVARGERLAGGAGEVAVLLEERRGARVIAGRGEERGALGALSRGDELRRATAKIGLGHAGIGSVRGACSRLLADELRRALAAT